MDGSTRRVDDWEIARKRAVGDFSEEAYGWGEESRTAYSVLCVFASEIDKRHRYRCPITEKSR